MKVINRDLAGCLEMDAPLEDAGFGALKTERGCLPLKALAIQADLIGLSAQLQVKQTFQNVFEEHLEATYIFPLPDRASVCGFQMKVGDRVIDGILKERGEARREYTEAIQSGHQAAIAEEERPGVFTLRVGNIPPQEEVSIELKLASPLVLVDGELEFRFPLVVAPRYTPGVPLSGRSVGKGTASDTNLVPDASRISPPVLLPGFPNPVELSIQATIHLDRFNQDENWQQQLQSSLSGTMQLNDTRCTIQIQPGERLNKDFLIRYPVATRSIQSKFIASSKSTPIESNIVRADAPQQASPFALHVIPPSIEQSNSVKPRDVIVLLDRSGSMAGWKMVAARRAVGRMVDSLLEQDRFNLLAFDTYVEMSSKQLVSATNRERWKALEWLAKVDSRGGTNLDTGLIESFKAFPKNAENREQIVIVVTDGQVSGEDHILKQLDKVAGKKIPRVYTLGIDRAVNVGFLNRLAEFGSGTCDCVESEDRLDEVMDRIHRTIGSPVITDISVQPVGFDLVADSITPSRIHDVFAGRPLTVYGRILGEVESLLAAAEHDLQFGFQLRGTLADGTVWKQFVPLNHTDSSVLNNLWGRSKIRELEDRYATGMVNNLKELSQEITKISLETNTLSRFTSFVVVDRSKVANMTGEQIQMIQPVESPEGIGSYGSVVMACYSPASESTLESTMDYDLEFQSDAGEESTVSDGLLHSLFGAVGFGGSGVRRSASREPQSPRREKKLMSQREINSNARDDGPMGKRAPISKPKTNLDLKVAETKTYWDRIMNSPKQRKKRLIRAMDLWREIRALMDSGNHMDERKEQVDDFIEALKIFNEKIASGDQTLLNSSAIEAFLQAGWYLLLELEGARPPLKEEERQTFWA